MSSASIILDMQARLVDFHRAIGFFLITGLMCLATPAYALSCAGLSDRFFLKCSSSHCEVIFRARDVPAAGGCEQRTIVDVPVAETNKVLLARVSREVSIGIYEITLVHRHCRKQPVSAEELAQAFGTQGLRARPLTVRQLACQCESRTALPSVDGPLAPFDIQTGHLPDF